MRVYSPMNLRAMLSADNIAQELQKVQTYLRQLDGAINQIPGITGNPAVGPSPPSIVPNPFDNFFYLPGRPGGQIGYGDTNASGILVLSSTRNATKGNIYLGSARTSAYDELNQRLGIKTTSPSAVLHVKGEAPSSLFWRPSSNTFNAAFSQGGTPAPPAGLAEVVADDFTSYIATTGSNPIGDINLKLDGVFAGTTPLPAPTANWVLRWKCCLLVDPGIAPVTYSWSILDENGGVVVSGTLEPSLQYISGSPNTFPVARTVNLTLGQATALATANGLGTTLSVGFHMDTFVGLGPSSSTNTWFLTQMELEIPGGTGVGLGQETAIFQAASGQLANNTEWQNSAGTALVDVTAAGRLTVESGGSFRHVPGAAASTLFKGDASGDASWGTITLLSAYVSDTLAGTVARGDLIVGNSTPKWSKFAIGAASTLLTSNGTDPAWATVNLLSAFHADTLTGSVASGDIIIGNATPKWARLAKGADGTVLTLVSGLPAWTAPSGGNHNLLSSTHSDTVASTPVRGGIIVANSTPAWAQLAVGSANTVIRSNGTDPSYGTIDHNYIDDRTRSIWITPSMMTTTTGTMSLGMVGTYPNNYHAWQFTTSAAAGNNKGVHMSFTVPLDWKTGTDMTIYIYTAKVAGGADAAGYDVITSYISRATAESLTTAVTANAFVGPLNSTTLHLLTITNAGTIANGTLSGGEYVKLNVVRDTDQEITDNGSSTNNTMGLVMVRIDYTAVM